MRIVVFGADGRTGKEVVSEALRRGHYVVAFVYRDAGTDFTSDSVTVMRER